MPAKLGKLEYYLTKSKFVNAARYYQKIRIVSLRKKYTLSVYIIFQAVYIYHVISLKI